MPPSKQQLLLLTFDSDLVDGCPLHVASNSSPIPWTGKEPAGHSFHEASLRKLGYGQECPADETPAEDKKEKAESPSVDSFHFKGRKKSNADGEQQDHYALLGLSHLRFLATEDQIRKSYRDLALKHHPDKQAALLLLEETDRAREEKKEEIDRHFKSIQEAYEILTDPIKRRLYDSIDEFDDEVPSDCSQEDFFKVFGPVFLRNARWSVSQPVPSLGDNSSSIADVDTFYDFWWSFKSWREFPHADEFDLEQAEGREHKRWMERQNGKLREKAKKEENGRIRTLIENAYKRDPRILRRKEEEKAEKLRKKEAKLLAKKEKELHAARLVEEERLRKVEENRRVAEEAAVQKKIREKEKKLLRKERQRLRAAAAVVTGLKNFGISDDAIECLCSSLEMAEMTRLCEKLENTKNCEGKAEILRVALKGIQYEFLSPEVPYATSTKSEDPNQYDFLSPEVPYATSTKSVDPNHGSLNSKRVSGADVANGNSSCVNQDVWSEMQELALVKALKTFPKDSSQRWERIAAAVPGKMKSQCFKKFAELKENFRSKKGID